MFVKSLLNLHKYRRFDYRPRYSDETKDKINDLRVQKGLEPRNNKPSSFSKSNNLRTQWSDSRKMTSHSGTSFRISIIFAILCIVAYFVIRLL